MLSKMHRIVVNCILVVGTYILPLYVLKQNQNNYAQIGMIQWVVFFVLLIGGCALTYLNHKNKVEVRELYWLWMLFKVVGILGVLYAIFVLFVLYGFSDLGF